MSSDLLRRVGRLEALLAQHTTGPVRLVCMYGKINDEQRAALAPGERVVRDWCACSSTLSARDRIATDPDDVGQRCGDLDKLPKECQPHSGESDGAGDKPACWLDRFMKERPKSMCPQATKLAKRKC